MKPMIQAHLVERDQFGFWTHPNYPDLADNCSSSEAQETLRRLGLELQNVFMESDAPRLYDSARSDQRYSEWIPTRPEGSGWFVLSIHDTDNGPVCQYVRPLGEHLSPIDLDAAAEQHERLLSEACAKALNQRDAALAEVERLSAELAGTLSSVTELWAALRPGAPAAHAPVWINLADRIPAPEEARYLIYQDDGSICISDYLFDLDIGWFFQQGHATHWLPLPFSPTPRNESAPCSRPSTTTGKEADIADLRAAQARPSVDLEHIGSLISVFRNATRADAENGGREYFESARNAERELREAIDRIVGELRREQYYRDILQSANAGLAKKLTHLGGELDAALANVDALAVQVLKLGGTISFTHHRTDRAGQVPQAWLDVQAERRRQVETEGWTPEHDDQLSDGQMAQAAGCYALHAGGIGTDWPGGIRNGSALFWPWDEEWWKPKSARENLVRAGALVLAEIERLDRSATEQGSTCCKGGA